MGEDRRLIFISIAAYRDPELQPTLDDCLAKARFPERLRFGICWQHAPDEEPLPWFSDARFRILDVDCRESKGACWARSEIMKLWDGEEWFLQLDSHHRFVEDWDIKLIRQARATKSPKPILTTYAGPYKPGVPPCDDEATKMNFDGFTEDGIVIFRPGGIPDWKSRKKPVPSRFLSAHFLFAPGAFVVEVPYDPDLYFLGEEITLTVRAYTHGYDLFHPSEVIVWHEYTRDYRIKHWDDHLDSFGEQDAASRIRAGKFLVNPNFGPYGCGRARTVAEYEAYAGLSFLHRRCQDHTRYHFLPPNPPQAQDWADHIRDNRVRIAFDIGRVPSEAIENSQFWYVGVFDADGCEIFRRDAEEEEIQKLLTGYPSEIVLVRSFTSTPEPATWLIMPYVKSRGWLDVRITGPVEFEKDEKNVAAQKSELCPRAVPGLILNEADNGFVVTSPVAPSVKHLLTHSGALLLEFANGRHSLQEIVETFRELYGLRQSPERDVLAFFDHACRNGLIENYLSGGADGQTH